MYQLTKKPKKGQRPLTQMVNEETYQDLKAQNKLHLYDIEIVEPVRVKEPKEIKQQPKQS
jgi:ribosomal protein L20A (L18A)